MPKIWRLLNIFFMAFRSHIIIIYSNILKLLCIEIVPFMILDKINPLGLPSYTFEKIHWIRTSQKITR